MSEPVSIRPSRQPIAVKVGEEWFIGMPTASEDLSPLSRGLHGRSMGAPPMLYLERATKWVRMQMPNPQGQSATIDGLLPIPLDKVWIVVSYISATMELSDEQLKQYDRVMAARAGIHLG